MADILSAVITMSYRALITAFFLELLWLLAALLRLRCSRTALLLLLLPVLFQLIVPWKPSQSPLSIYNWELAQAYVDGQTDLLEHYVGDVQVASSTGYNGEDYERALAAGAIPKEDYHGWNYVYYYKDKNGVITPAKTFGEVYGHMAAGVWLGATGIILIYTGVSYLLLKRRLRFAVRDERLPGVWYSDRIKTPCVVGFLHPQIYLTFGLTEGQKEHILLHEREHIRNGDHLWKVLWWTLLAFHWFNPILWSLYRVVVSMLEEACDQRVMNRLGREHRQAYSDSLLSLAERPWLAPGPSPVAFGESDVRGRVKAVLRYRRPIPALTALVLLAGAALSLCLLTGPIS